MHIGRTAGDIRLRDLMWPFQCDYGESPWMCRRLCDRGRGVVVEDRVALDTSGGGEGVEYVFIE